MEALFQAVIICLAVLVVWPRGYLLIYLIDRSKSFSFGFKFLVGWLIGLAGMVCDVYSSNVFGHTRLLPWVFLFNSVSQIFGFGFMIFIFERKLPLPKPHRLLRFLEKQLVDFLAWSRAEKLVFGLLILIFGLQIFSAVSAIDRIPVFAFDSDENMNYKAKIIFYTKNISTDTESPFYFGGGPKVDGLSDPMLKAWVAIAAGEYDDRKINYVSLLYYAFLVLIFFYFLPSDLPRLFRFAGTIAMALLSPLSFSIINAPIADWLLGLFLMLSIFSLWYYWQGRGNSYYYFSGIALSFACWCSIEAILFVLPAMFLVKTFILLVKRVKLKDYLLDWFFAWLTTIGWTSSLIWFLPDISRFDFNYLLVQFLPSLIMLGVLGLGRLLEYLREISSV